MGNENSPLAPLQPSEQGSNGTESSELTWIESRQPISHIPTTPPSSKRGKRMRRSADSDPYPGHDDARALEAHFERMLNRQR